MKTNVRSLCLIKIEGIAITARALPQRRLSKTWKQLTDQPLPKVKALQLEDVDFDRVINLRRCEEDEHRELQEWNTILSTEGTDACVFNANENSSVDYMILIRKHPFHNLEEILQHELSHIARADL